MVNGESVPDRGLGEGVGEIEISQMTRQVNLTSGRGKSWKSKCTPPTEATTAVPWLDEEIEEGRPSPFPFQRTSRWPSAVFHYPVPPISPSSSASPSHCVLDLGMLFLARCQQRCSCHTNAEQVTDAPPSVTMSPLEQGFLTAHST